MHTVARTLARTLAPLAVAITAACGGTPGEPELPPAIAFSAQELAFGAERNSQVEVRNDGGIAVGPVELLAGQVRDERGASVPGTSLRADPREIPTLNPGGRATVSLRVDVGSTLLPGRYGASLTARAGAGVQAIIDVSFDVLPAEGAVGISILTQSATVRTGDVVPLAVEVRSDGGQLVEGAAVAWEMTPQDAGFLAGTGHFVGYRPGSATLVARAGGLADTLSLEITPRGLSGSFSRVGQGVEPLRYTSDLWLHGDHAYVGSWGLRSGLQGVGPGNALSTWRVTDASAPVKVAELILDARTVNDVKVRADGALGLATHEGSNDGLNGVTLLDLSNPARPRAVSRYTENLQSGVHNAWLDGNHAYLVRDGVGNGLQVLDVSDPARPRGVATFYGGTSFLHDVYVRDGLAFLSHWNAGLIILDVGNGVRGGSPGNPVEVSRIEVEGGQVHNAWYWPEAGYVFVGEEDFATPGRMHVVDVRNLLQPREVATFDVPGDSPHNFWLDEDRAVLYMAWYSNGVVALDVSGDLLGDLSVQGRMITSSRYNGGAHGCNRPSTFTCAWAPQLHRGVIWVSDMNQGLVALQPPS